jgi:plastocyanin
MTGCPTSRRARRTRRGFAIGFAAAMLLAGVILGGETTAGAADTAKPTTTTSIAAASTAAASTAAPRTIDVSARSYRFTPSKLQMTKGESVTIALKSTDAFHDFVVTGPGVNNKTVVKTTGAGKTKRGTLKLNTPGTYQYFCSTPGHRSAGMRGTITVS